MAPCKDKQLVLAPCQEGCQCCWISKQATTHTNFKTKETWPISSPINCKTRNVVYKLGCDLDKREFRLFNYEGNTKRQLRVRINEHRSAESRWPFFQGSTMEKGTALLIQCSLYSYLLLLIHHTYTELAVFCLLRSHGGKNLPCTVPFAKLSNLQQYNQGKKQGLKGKGKI